MFFLEFIIFGFLFYRRRNVKINIRKRKPLKQQMNIMAKVVTFEDGFVLVVEGDNDEKTRKLACVVGKYSIFLVDLSSMSNVGFI
jgi:hypothetical protein